MEGKARFIFPVMISALIVFVVSGVVTFTNIGLRADFVPRWLKAFITGWPVAAILAFIAVPHIRRATEAIVRLIEGAGMPFTSFIEGFQVEPRKGGSRLTLRVEYEVSGMIRMIEPLTVRSRMRRTTVKSLKNIEQHFA